jgi:hypothetical protein
MFDITNVFLLILFDVVGINKLWNERTDRRVLHHLQNCRYNPNKIPYIKLFQKLIQIKNSKELIIEGEQFNFDKIEGNGINTYSKDISALTGGQYSKRSTLYYKDFPKDDKRKLLLIGYKLKTKIEEKINKKLFWGESDFKIVLLRYEGDKASFAWHYDTEPLNCYRTLTLIKANGKIPPFCYKNVISNDVKLNLELGDTIFFKGTQTYHKVENSNDENTVRWMLGFQFCDSEYDINSKTICSELRGASVKDIILTFLPNILQVVLYLQLYSHYYSHILIGSTIFNSYIYINLIVFFHSLWYNKIDIKTYLIFYIYTLVYLDVLSSFGYISYILITE